MDLLNHYGDLLEYISKYVTEEEPAILYGSLAAMYYVPNLVNPTDIDLVLPKDIIQKVYKGLLEDLDFEEATPKLLLERLYTSKLLGIEIHDFEHYESELVLFENATHNMKWGDLKQVASPLNGYNSVFIPDIYTLVFLYLKYFRDWQFLDKLTPKDNSYRSYVDSKWPSICNICGMLLVKCIKGERDPWKALLKIRARAHTFGMPQVLDNLSFVMEACFSKPIRRHNSEVCNNMQAIQGQLWCLGSNIVSKKCLTSVFFYNRKTGAVTELRNVEDYIQVDKEFSCLTPNSASIQLTDKCNLSCDHCAFSRGKRIMSENSFSELLDFLEFNGVFEINLGEGGEATLHPSLAKFIKQAYQRNFGVGVTSNLSRKIDINTLEVFASFTSGVNTSFDEMHYSDVDAARTMFSNINLLKERGCRVGINIAYSPNNIRGLHKAAKYVISECPKIDQISLLKISSIGDSAFTKLFDLEKLEDVVELILSHGISLGRHCCDHRTSKAAESYIGEPIKPYCPAWSESVYIDVDGRMSPCGIHKAHEKKVLSSENIPFKDQKFNEEKKYNMCAYIAAEIFLLKNVFMNTIRESEL